MPLSLFLIYKTSINIQPTQDLHQSAHDKFKKHLRIWHSCYPLLIVGRLEAAQGLTLVWFWNAGAGRRWRAWRARWAGWAWQTLVPWESWWTSRACVEGESNT